MEQFNFIPETIHTAEPTKEFWLAEMERCKDPWYYYTHYWTVNGKAAQQYTKEQWDSMQNYSYSRNFKRRYTWDMMMVDNAIEYLSERGKPRRRRKRERE